MNDIRIRQLLALIREQCSASTWSQAVELVRSNAVIGETIEGDEVRLRVSTNAGLVSPMVTLWPEEGDFWCDCDSTHDQACAHAAAAIIALNQARKAGKNLPISSQPTGTIGYRFQRTNQGLSFDRVVVFDNREEPLRSTLSAVALGKVAGPKFIANQHDLTVERALGSRRFGLLERHELPDLFEALSTCPDIQLDGKPVQVGPPKPPVHVKVEDCAEGFRLTAVQDPAINEIFGNGAVLQANALRVLGEPGLTARELDEFRKGKVVAFQEAPFLIADLLPSLEKRVPLQVQSKKLPSMDMDALPRIHIENQRDDNNLVLLASIVYGDPPTARVDGDHLTHLQGTIPLRRPEMEQRLLRTLESELGLAPGQKLRLPPEQGLAMAERLRSLTRDITLSGKGHEGFFKAGDLRADLHVQGDDFDITFATEKGGRADPSAVLRAWNTGESMVPLLDGGFASLPNGFLDRFGGLLGDLLAARTLSQDKKLPISALPDLAKLCEALEVQGPPGFEKLRTLLENFEGIPETVLPNDLVAILRPYQQKGVNWLAFLRSAGLGALLADDMGLGKTLQALCVLEGRSLVVAPTSVVHNWMAEAKRFRPALRCNLYHGPRRSLDSDADLTLTTYALLRLDAEKLCSIKWDTVVLDEAHYIKNPDSQVAQAAFSLDASFRIGMTGTPIENRLDELWSQFHAINRGLLGTREDFRDRVIRPILDGTPGVSARLRERIRPFVLRRRKAEVAPELPPRTDIVLHCELDDQERALYQSIYGAMTPSVVEKLQKGGNVMAALEALLRLRQAACHPGLLPGREAQSSSKTELLLEMLERVGEGGHKALVFSQWTSLLDHLEPHLKKAAIDFVRLDGSTRDREAVVRSFQEQEGPPVMLVSLKAGGTGLNLTAADHVFLMDPWWNPAVEDQAADRTHRIGQEKPVMVYKLVAKDTVEERILELQQHKRWLAETALEGGDVAAGLTRDDLLMLLS